MLWFRSTAPGYLFSGFADRRTGEFRHCNLSDRSSAAPVAHADRLGHRAVGWYSFDHLRHVGLFVFGPFMAEHLSPWITENLGALPLIGPMFQGPPLGIGMLTAGIVLAIMITPFITSVMQEVFRTVPVALKESAYALGGTTGKWSGTSCCLTPVRPWSVVCSRGWGAHSAKPWR